jgi:hypothetical protein
MCEILQFKFKSIDPGRKSEHENNGEYEKLEFSLKFP